MALLSDQSRNATIQARTAMNVLIIPKGDFDKLRHSVPAFGEIFPRAGATTNGQNRAARVSKRGPRQYVGFCGNLRYGSRTPWSII